MNCQNPSVRQYELAMRQGSATATLHAKRALLWQNAVLLKIHLFGSWARGSKTENSSVRFASTSTSFWTECANSTADTYFTATA